MIVPIFNSLIRIDKSIIEAAYDSGANGFQILTNIIIPLCKPGIIIGSIFVITVVMGDFLTIGIMGGQQIASIGKIIQVEMSYLQLPAAAANAAPPTHRPRHLPRRHSHPARRSPPSRSNTYTASALIELKWSIMCT